LDIVAHGLWAGLGIAWAGKYHRINTKTKMATIGLAVAPDLIHLLPLMIAAPFAANGLEIFTAYVNASPGFEPPLSPNLNQLTHHLHCVMHSALVAGAITAAVWLWLGRLWVPLLGWWSHILIDVFTHSAEFYPSPVLYPLTYWGFDGIAWNAPWFMSINYAVMTIVAYIIFLRRN
jgi:hypothetical protein